MPGGGLTFKASASFGRRFMKVLSFPSLPGQPPYTTTVHEPTMGELFRIEALKLSLASEARNYDEWIRVNTPNAGYTLDGIDTIAHLSVMCPTMVKDLSLGSFLDLPMSKGTALIKVFKEQFWPWFWPQYRQALEDTGYLQPEAKVSVQASRPEGLDLNDPDLNLDDHSDPAALAQAMAQAETVGKHQANG